jgi:glycosyltransferase involved in cell wall biosynthesis
MPAYNHEKYVRAAIDSVLDQSFQDFEIVITDDGSTDDTVAQIRAVDDSRVSLVALPKNCGACVAMNACIRRARGQYVAILNSDDLFLPHKLEVQTAILDRENNIAAVFGRPIFMQEDGTPFLDASYKDNVLFRITNRERHEWLRHFFFHGNALCHPSAMVRRRCYEEVGLYNSAFAQLPDLDMWIRILRRYEIKLLEEPLVGFRILPNQLNASAARPDVIVRDRWERWKVLEHYGTLDDELLHKIFPELPHIVRRRAVSRWMADLALRALDRYVGGNISVKGERGRHATANTGIRPLKWSLAELALSVGEPAHVLFAFDLLYRVLADLDDDDRYAAFIGKTGSMDPFGLLYNVPENRALGRIAPRG